MFFSNIKKANDLIFLFFFKMIRRSEAVFQLCNLRDVQMATLADKKLHYVTATQTFATGEENLLVDLCL
jgi:hypothetical protein